MNEQKKETKVQVAGPLPKATAAAAAAAASLSMRLSPEKTSTTTMPAHARPAAGTASTSVRSRPQHEYVEHIYPFIAETHCQLRHAITSMGQKNLQQKLMKIIKQFLM